jgi:tetratricopeptide (TPR) repeat protein
MSVKPVQPARPIEPAQGEATGAFLPETPTTPDLAAGDEAVPARAPECDATGLYPPPEQSSAPAVEAPAADATGVFVPEDARPPVGAPADGSTGIYEAGVAATPRSDGEVTEQLDGVGATGVYAAAQEPADGATGVYTAVQESAGGAAGDFDLAPEVQQAADAAAAPAGPAKAPAADAADVKRCGRYVLKRFHAKGGMGEIWFAEDPAIGRSVALKRMLGRRPDAQARFVVEAQITGQLEHPGIVPVHELGTTPDGRPFYIMKFVHGRTLKQVIQEYHEARKKGGGSHEVEELRLLQHFIALCQTVAYAHSRGVLHRDIKPENVMLGPYGETLVLDWGIAKILGRPEAAPADAAYVELKGAGVETGTQAGAIMGSPSYMAPEVAAGLNDQVDQVSDVYLLGATLYEILTGTLPRRAETVLELLTKAQKEPPVPPRRVNPQVPRALEAICLKAMASRKEDRYPSALEVAEDVQRFLAGEPVAAYPEGPLVRALRWAKRHRTALIRSGVALLFVGLISSGGYLLYRVEQRRIREAQEAEQRRIEEAQQAERERREIEAQRQKEAHDADVLRQQQQARVDLKEFLRLADEMQFYAATTDSMSEHTPYFDPRKGEATGRDAVALADKWGATLEELPLQEEQARARKELYDLLLLMAQVKSAQASQPEAARELLALLDRAAPLQEPSRSYYRLRSQAHGVLNEKDKADEEQRRADDPQTPATALDHFLLGERYRQETVKEASSQTEHEVWEGNRSRREKAIEEYRRALKLDPEHFWAHFQIGRCSLQLKKGAEAVEALTYCVALRPKSPWGYTVRGLILGELNRYAEAEADLSRAIEMAPDPRPARLNRGVVRRLQKKNDAALADFNEVLRPPDDQRLIEAAYYRGEIYLQRGEVDKALADFDLVVKERPDLRHVYTDRAQIFLARGQEAKALEDINSYLSLGGPYDPKSAAGHAQRGRLFRFLELAPALQKTKVALAVADLDEAVRLGFRSADLFDDLGAMLEQDERLEGEVRLKAAIAAYSKGLDLRPKDVLLLIKRGWAWDGLGQRDKAHADFQAALRQEPNNAEAHSGLGYLRAVAKLPAGAQQEADLALLHGADLPPERRYLVLHNVACIYAKLAEADARQATAYQDVAIALLRRAIDLWKRGGSGPSEIQQIEGEPAFPPALRERPEFKALLRTEGP